MTTCSSWRWKALHLLNRTPRCHWVIEASFWLGGVPHWTSGGHWCWASSPRRQGLWKCTRPSGWHCAQVGRIPAQHPILWPPLVPVAQCGVEGRKDLGGWWGWQGWDFHMWTSHTDMSQVDLHPTHYYCSPVQGFRVRQRGCGLHL